MKKKTEMFGDYGQFIKFSSWLTLTFCDIMTYNFLRILAKVFEFKKMSDQNFKLKHILSK